MSYCVGLTGGIASGKTTVANFFKQFGVQVIDTDQIAFELLQADNPCYDRVIEHFGPAIQEDKQLNRAALRDIIFENEHERHWQAEVHLSFNNFRDGMNCQIHPALHIEYTGSEQFVAVAGDAEAF